MELLCLLDLEVGCKAGDDDDGKTAEEMKVILDTAFGPLALNTSLSTENLETSGKKFAVPVSKVLQFLKLDPTARDVACKLWFSGSAGDMEESWMANKDFPVTTAEAHASSGILVGTDVVGEFLYQELLTSAAGSNSDPCVITLHVMICGGVKVCLPIDGDALFAEAVYCEFLLHPELGTQLLYALQRIAGFGTTVVASRVMSIQAATPHVVDETEPAVDETCWIAMFSAGGIGGRRHGSSMHIATLMTEYVRQHCQPDTPAPQCYFVHGLIPGANDAEKLEFLHESARTAIAEKIFSKSSENCFLVVSRSKSSHEFMCDVVGDVNERLGYFSRYYFSECVHAFTGEPVVVVIPELPPCGVLKMWIEDGSDVCHWFSVCEATWAALMVKDRKFVLRSRRSIIYCAFCEKKLSKMKDAGKSYVEISNAICAGVPLGEK